MLSSALTALRCPLCCPLRQASCNVVMNGLVSSLLPLFIRKLGDDYQRWATDAKYRADRATRSKPLS